MESLNLGMNFFSTRRRRLVPLILILMLSLFTACGGDDEEDASEAFLFNPVDTTFVSPELKIPGGKYKVDILYREGQPEKVEWKKIVAPAKGMQDFMAFLPINGSLTHGILWVNHATQAQHDQIGDGGGASVMEVYRDSVDGWISVGFPYAIDFDAVGGTLHNSLGTVTPWGTVLISEEIEPSNMHDLARRDSLSPAMMRDTTDWKGWNRNLNFGWMVEVDPIKREVLGKRPAMGRFLHEGTLAMADEKTVYMLDAEAPGAFFKFVADTARNMRSGRLYAYRHVPDSLGSYWLPLAQGRDTMLHARRYAFQGGATIFFGTEDIALLPDGTMIISETGKDTVDANLATAQGGIVAAHLERLLLGNKRYSDKYGRLLRYDPKSEKMTVLLEGGQALEDKSIVLSNPDNIAYDQKRNLLVIQEDIHGASAGRMPNGSGIMGTSKGGKPAQIKVVNEIYFLDLSKTSPKLDDLRRFAVIPAGFTSTGAIFSPDFSSLFVNIQQVDAGGTPPYDRSMTIVISGFDE